MITWLRALLGVDRPLPPTPDDPRERATEERIDAATRHAFDVARRLDAQSALLQRRRQRADFDEREGRG